MLLKLITFDGEIPRLPGHLLPDNNAQLSINGDFQHGELRGIRNNQTVGIMTPMDTLPNDPMTYVWTEDGQWFFAWPWPVDVVKSPVVEDIHHRIYYTGLPPDAPVMKVARTYRNDGGTLTQVIGSSIVGGNFRPPEASNPVNNFGNGLGPDSWYNGIPPPRAQNIAEDDVLTVTQVDKASWPGAYSLKLRVTFIVEDTAGKIVYQQDISNTEEAQVLPLNPSNIFPSVAYTNDPANRGNLIQDMMWPIGGFDTPAPFKYYWCDPPDLTLLPMGRTVTIKNTDAALNYTAEYTTSDPDPLDGAAPSEQA
jgi:hypothetical protein